MPDSVYDLLREMDAQHVVVAYSGVIDGELLESVYAMMDKHLDERMTPADKKKKLFHVLIESLQNVFHHQLRADEGAEKLQTGFVIKYTGDVYTIVTGNNILNTSVPRLKEKLDKVNSLSPSELRTYYQESLAKTELSDKGGAGLGIIEMARKSGNKLKYEFAEVNGQFTFFTLEVTI